MTILMGKFLRSSVKIPVPSKVTVIADTQVKRVGLEKHKDPAQRKNWQ